MSFLDLNITYNHFILFILFFSVGSILVPATVFSVVRKIYKKNTFIYSSFLVLLTMFLIIAFIIFGGLLKARIVGIATINISLACIFSLTILNTSALLYKIFQGFHWSIVAFGTLCFFMAGLCLHFLFL